MIDLPSQTREKNPPLGRSCGLSLQAVAGRWPPDTVKTAILSRVPARRIIGAARNPTWEVTMHDGTHAPLTGNRPVGPRQKPRSGLVAGMAVLLWALVSAMWAEI